MHSSKKTSFEYFTPTNLMASRGTSNRSISLPSSFKSFAWYKRSYRKRIEHELNSVFPS